MMDHVDKILEQWREERPELVVEPMGTIGRINSLHQNLVQGMSKTWAEHDLTAASFDVLATLRRSGLPYALSPGDLMAWTMVTSGTMTNRIDQLEKAGLIERLRNPADGRGFLVSLSKKGLGVIDAAVTEHVATQGRLVSILSDGERRQLDALLKKFQKGFSK